MNINKIMSLPFRLTGLFLFISLAFLACKDDTEEISVVAQDLILSVDEYPLVGQALGKVTASTNQGELSYAVITQSPSNSVSINVSTGEIKVNNVTHFNYQENQIIKGVIQVSNGNVSENVNLIINIKNINQVEINNFTTTIYENPEALQVIGSVDASSEEGKIIYSIVSQSPDNSFSVNHDTGELKVINPSHFVYSKNQTITGQVMANSNGVTDVAEITINLLKIDPVEVKDDQEEVKDDFVINNQTELDHFVEMQYHAVIGSLTISDDGSGNPIKSLEQLTFLTSVNSITITGLDNITDLKGLENLSIVGGIFISDCRNLLNLDALSNLNNALFLVFTDNAKLEFYCGLQNILSKYNFIDYYNDDSPPPPLKRLSTLPPPRTLKVKNNKSNPKVVEILAMTCD